MAATLPNTTSNLGGATGDTLGAACELTEVGVLLGMVVLAAAA